MQYFGKSIIFFLLVATVCCSNLQDKQKIHEINKYTLANQLRFDYFDTGIRHKLYNLKGLIYSMTHYDYSPEGDSLILDKSSYKLFFDSNKVITQRAWFHSRGIPSNKVWFRSYLYKQRDSVKSYNKNGTFSHGTYYTYDSSGFLHSTRILNKDKSIEVKKFSILLRGDTLISEQNNFINKFLDGKLIQRCYAKNGIIIENYEYYPNGALRIGYNKHNGFSTSIRKFNKSGYPILMEGFEVIDKRLNQIQGRRMTFNEHLRLTSIESYSKLKKEYIRSSKQIYKNGLLLFTFGTRDSDTAAVYHYNDKGDLLEKKSYFNTETYKYLKYDSMSNWIKREHYLNDKLWEVEAREFEYYK